MAGQRSSLIEPSLLVVRTKAGGAIPISSTPEGLREVIQNTYEDTADIVREFHIQLQ
jgi:hypothetical protein